MIKRSLCIVLCALLGLLPIPSLAGVVRSKGPAVEFEDRPPGPPTPIPVEPIAEDPEEFMDLATHAEHAGVIADLTDELMKICDPTAVDGAARTDQARAIAARGLEAVRARHTIRARVEVMLRAAGVYAGSEERGAESPPGEPRD